MIPGYGPSKLREETIASAATIAVKADLVRITGSTQIETIGSPILLDRDGALIFLVAIDGAVNLGASGNIAVAITMAQNRLHVLAYSGRAGKWYPQGL